ncbi:centrosomal protein of 72 kDa isoform X1 [Takifugu rubripes]|uniref:Centrosomal protein 72 n=1 Tax=Takifugu rubripes TaxID=31033 RepID=H2UGZ3_TAKRU|nr:centrosomal protein of 72 kDa isoform X1 [Takifugu rubripes]
MAADFVTTATEQWIRDTLQLNHPYLADVRSLSLPGTYKKKICHLGDALKNFICLRVLDLSYNALVTITGIEHLKGLERLTLYFNCISSVDVLKELYELPALRELDLRLNPLIRRHPHYRLTLVHNMPRLGTLDDRPVSERERTAATMQFSTMQSSSEHLSPQKSTCVNKAADKRSGDHVTKRLPLLTGLYDMESNFRATHEETKAEESKDFTEQSSPQKQENAKCISGSSPSKSGGTSHQRITSPIVTDTSKKSFGPVDEKGESVSAEQCKKGLPIQTRHIAKGYYTPNPNQSHHSNSSLVNIRPPSPSPGLRLSDPSNPTLCPSRPIHCTVKKREGGPGIQPHKEKRKMGGYRKSLEMLLNLVDKHWTGQRSLHHHKNFLSQAVHILSMMEKDVSTRESEVKTLRGKVDTLNVRASKQTDEHQAEVRNLYAQLQDACSEVSSLRGQLRNVLGENASLQKQLLGLERRHFRRTRSSPIVRIEEAKADMEELRKVMERLKERVEEAGKSMDPCVPCLFQVPEVNTHLEAAA